MTSILIEIDHHGVNPSHPGTRLVRDDEGHELGNAWTQDAQAWLRERL